MPNCAGCCRNARSGSTSLKRGAGHDWQIKWRVHVNTDITMAAILSLPLKGLPMHRSTRHWLACLLLLSTLAGCRRGQPEQAVQREWPGTGTPATAAAPADGALLQDVSENTSDYLIGISYPPVAKQYPALAAELKAYAEQARTQLMQAVQGRDDGDEQLPYELVLPFHQLHASATLVVVGAEGSIYTGGAHGEPLIARWVWLPAENRLLRTGELVPDDSGWQAISQLVREQLHTALSQRVDADELPPGERTQVLKAASRMIDEGTQPDPEHFSQFEPLVGADGRIRALRFVFPPYQVGPYSDGTQTVEIPAALILPYVAPEYRRLFQGG